MRVIARAGGVGMSAYGPRVRSCVTSFLPYMPGRSISEVKRRYGLTRVVKLASNENPLGPSPRAVAAAARAVSGASRYPVGDAHDLREALAGFHRVSMDEIIAGAGTDEIIEILGKTFLDPGDEIVVSRHAFCRYRMAGLLMGARVRTVPMTAFTHDLDRMRAAVTRRTKLLFIANTNNPTGTYVRVEAMKRFLRALPRRVLVILDEAYYEYAAGAPGYPDGVSLFRGGAAQCMVLRTFSKVYGLAGLRVGYGVGRKDVIACMDRIRPPFNVSAPAQAAARASLGDRSYVKQCLRAMVRERERLMVFLRQHGVPFVPSAANFLLVDARGLGTDGAGLFLALMRRGVIVREMGEYALPAWVRISIGTTAEMTVLMHALRGIARQKKRRIP